MKVLITGATGYIGSGVAQAFRRAGHTVWGLVLEEKDVRTLAKQEIFAVVGDLNEPDSYRRVAQECDALIHCAADYRHDWAGSDRQTIETMIAASQAARQPKTVIFTSGSWVYGNTNGQAANEGEQLSPIQIGSHRPGVEQMLLNAPGVRGMVIRPGNVYGKREGMLNDWLSDAYHNTEIIVPGDGANHWPMVHVDDLGQGYLLAAEKGKGGEIFNIAGPYHPTVHQLLDAIVQVSSFTGTIRYIPLSEGLEQIGPNAEAIALDLMVDSSKASRILGWQPRHPGFVEEAQVYYHSWLAWRIQEQVQKQGVRGSTQQIIQSAAR